MPKETELGSWQLWINPTAFWKSLRLMGFFFFSLLSGKICYFQRRISLSSWLPFHLAWSAEIQGRFRYFWVNARKIEGDIFLLGLRYIHSHPVPRHYCIKPSYRGAWVLVRNHCKYELLMHVFLHLFGYLFKKYCMKPINFLNGKKYSVFSV